MYATSTQPLNSGGQTQLESNTEVPASPNQIGFAKKVKEGDKIK